MIIRLWGQHVKDRVNLILTPTEWAVTTWTRHVFLGVRRRFPFVYGRVRRWGEGR